jgi:hypothetical protein
MSEQQVPTYEDMSLIDASTSSMKGVIPTGVHSVSNLGIIPKDHSKSVAERAAAFEATKMQYDEQQPVDSVEMFDKSQA